MDWRVVIVITAWAKQPHTTEQTTPNWQAM
jgi:hypothetical protein